VPRKEEIDRVRLTPITAGFRPLAELSARIASRRGLSPLSTDEGECKGVLLDVAELWELYVLGAIRRAWPGADVAHGTRDLGETRPLLTNQAGSGIGMMKPDAVVRSAGRPLLVADAKYKRLWPTQYTQAPQREDIYQMAAYVGRFGAGSAPGALLYPEDPESPGTPPAEAGGPWLMADGSAISFITLPHRVDAAADKLIRALGDLNAENPQATGRFAA
jgi:5-methylcytosine-specific restriction enzyme subunit McrC